MSTSVAIVIDCGSYRTRVGLSGRDQPTASFPTVVGSRPGDEGPNKDDIFVGADALAYRSSLVLTNPVDKYGFSDMDAMCGIWQHCWEDQLGCDSLESIPMLLTDGPLEEKLREKNRAAVAEVMFETHHVPSFYVALQPYLALKGLGKETGLVVDVGDSMASAVPVVDGAVVKSAIRSSDTVTGRTITDHLMNLLNAGQQAGGPIQHREIANDIKEKHGYVAWDYDWELKLAGSSEAKSYALQGGKEIILGTECFRCTEPLFRPSLLGLKTDGGLHRIAEASIISLEDETARSRLYECILTTGGSTKFAGLPERLCKELQEIDRDAAAAARCGRARVLAPPMRELLAWLGGSAVASSDEFRELSVSKIEYQEHGPAIVNRKCTH